MSHRSHYPDQQAWQGHHQNTQAEDPLAPQVVREVRHQDAAQRPRQVPGDEDAEALQQAQPLRHFGREEQLAEGKRKEHENDEVVDFQRAAQRSQAQGPVIAAAEPGRASGIDGSHGRVRKSAKGKRITNSGPVALPAAPLAVEHRVREVGPRPWPHRSSRHATWQRQFADQQWRVDDRHERLQRLVIWHVRQAQADRLAFGRRY